MNGFTAHIRDVSDAAVQTNLDAESSIARTGRFFESLFRPHNSAVFWKRLQRFPHTPLLSLYPAPYSGAFFSRNVQLFQSFADGLIATAERVRDFLLRVIRMFLYVSPQLGGSIFLKLRLSGLSGILFKAPLRKGYAEKEIVIAGESFTGATLQGIRKCCQVCAFPGPPRSGEGVTQ